MKIKAILFGAALAAIVPAMAAESHFVIFDSREAHGAGLLDGRGLMSRNFD